jgi:hypothetical protein
MPTTTEEDYDALDELFTRTTPKLGPNGTGFLSRRYARLFGMSDMTLDYLMTKAMSANKSPGELVNELVREKIADGE